MYFSIQPAHHPSCIKQQQEWFWFVITNIVLNTTNHSKLHQIKHGMNNVHGFISAHQQSVKPVSIGIVKDSFSKQPKSRMLPGIPGHHGNPFLFQFLKHRNKLNAHTHHVQLHFKTTSYLCSIFRTNIHFASRIATSATSTAHRCL